MVKTTWSARSKADIFPETTTLLFARLFDTIFSPCFFANLTAASMSFFFAPWAFSNAARVRYFRFEGASLERSRIAFFRDSGVAAGRRTTVTRIISLGFGPAGIVLLPGGCTLAL